MRTRLILSFVFVMLVSIASVVLIARRSTAREVQAFMFRGSMVNVDTLGGELEDFYRTNGSWQGVVTLLSRNGQGMMRGQGMAGMAMMGQRLRLADSSGELLLDSSGEATGALNAAERRSAQALRVNGRVVGYLLVEGGIGVNDSSYLLNRLNRAALIAGLIAGGIALVVALLLSDRLLLPVRQLTGAAQRMADGDLTQRVAVHGTDELAELGQAFNHMADSLHQAEVNRQAMTADISHELRNPLAVQRAHLEALQDGIYPPTAENLQPVLDQNLLLTRLVDDLRTLALADAGQLQLECTPADLTGLVRRIVERFTSQAAVHGIELVVVVDPGLQKNPLIVNVDPLRLEQILGNLLSNAQRYTPEGGKIVVNIDRSKQSALVRVIDSGPGIPADELPRIFERFYRVDRSRSRTEGGSGLGLAIARQLAEMHGGTLTAANVRQGGAEFTLCLPNENK